MTTPIKPLNVQNSGISDYGWELVCGSREEGFVAGGSNQYNVQFFDAMGDLVSYIALLEKSYNHMAWNLNGTPKHENQVLVLRRYDVGDGTYYKNYEVDSWDFKTNNWRDNTGDAKTLMWRECGAIIVKGRSDRELMDEYNE